VLSFPAIEVQAARVFSLLRALAPAQLQEHLSDSKPGSFSMS
jgi:hypothetical protein